MNRSFLIDRSDLFWCDMVHKIWPRGTGPFHQINDGVGEKCTESQLQCTGAVMVSMVEDNKGIPMGIRRVDILPDGVMLRLVPKFENERVF